jgi:hypothetical protein
MMRNGSKNTEIYGLLSLNRGEWVDGWQLAQAVKVTSLSAHIRDVRKQLKAGERLECQKARRADGKPGFWYRLADLPAAAVPAGGDSWPEGARSAAGPATTPGPARP